MEQSVALIAVENVAYHFDIFYSYIVPDYLKDKHFFRKHGANAYYGQN